ncbi:NAD-dependent epimerase/dehydratase family protein [Roseburia sp. 499]|uniref:NAD-dependent epimerase/dehydratase family protein n=1 Tax=Roseburia sp. 499 TaxID=1261634 RepID=UPI000951530E|nr:NAD-dependent epimerase/dehydratase family protein [Roseburia sp. 499]WVK68573.1 NAD-dependent epimerase/dehydratase family protein [Roseburia sp. 499]
MKKILITGGTVFVSQYVASYFVKKGEDVYVLNRNHYPQVEGVTLIEEDRHCLNNRLKKYDFDVILDITGYTKSDVQDLVEALGEIKQYIFISSSAIYPETLPQPFREEQEGGYNSIWGDYGINKYEAEQYLQEQVEQYYIVRPPYLYGPMQNLYREGFVFDCAVQERPFYLPKEGKMPLQFFHVEDLCRFLEILIEQKPKERIFNVGNSEIVDIKEWVQLCYQVAGKIPEFISVDDSRSQRSYFCFHDYGYVLDVSRQNKLLKNTKPLEEGLRESFEWYMQNQDKVRTKPYFEYIAENIK